MDHNKIYNARNKQILWNHYRYVIRCGDFEAVIKIRDFTVLQGYLPPRALGMVMEWAVIHNDELLNNWKLISEGKPSVHIDPLI